MFADLDQALDELDQVIEAQDVSNLFVIYDQPIDDEGSVVPFEVVAEEMVEDEAFDGEQVVYVDVIPDEVYAAMVGQYGVLAVVDVDVISNEVYAAMIAQDMLEDDDDGDVIPIEVYDEMVAQEILEDQYGDVISTEVYDAMVAQEMLEDQTRAIKRKRVMADKAGEGDAE
ncbi:hypothetical protein Tco_1262416 [Tanacetum coccineum]